MKKLIITFVSVLALGSVSTYGCLLAGKSATKFDPEEYVFIGKVVGYTDAVPFDNDMANGSANAISSTMVDEPKPTQFVNYGLIVDVVESVYLPTKVKTYEVFEYGLRADCLITGVPKYYFPDKFPIGSEVRVISKKATFVGSSSNGRIRLENKLDEDHDISLNTDPSARRVTSSASVFDYKKFETEPGRNWIGRKTLPIFELRKDLLRLSTATTDQERHSILDRIYNAPISRGIDHGGVFKDNTSSETEYRSYYDRFLKERDPELYHQVKAYNDALDRLLAKGYNKKEAEEALGKALETGTDIEASKLYEASLKFLPKPKK